MNDVQTLKLQLRQVDDSRLRVMAERDKYRAALAQIAKKVPHLVSREEAADMACEFVMVARSALGVQPEAGREA